LHINRLELTNFRNHGSLTIECSKGLNVICGENGAGKTNILEAILVCACGRSHRTTKDNELVKFKEEGYRLGVWLTKDECAPYIEIIYFLGQKGRIIKVNHIAIKKLSDLMGNLVAVMFSPSSLAIIKQGPSERRRFIDIAISQLRPTYFYDLQQYNKVLNQRNYLLKSIQSNRKLIDTLEIWDEKLISIGARIMHKRADFINEIRGLTLENYYKITEQQEKLNLVYQFSIQIESEQEKDIKSAFAVQLKKSLNSEIARGSTLYGPHRDECNIFLNDLNIKSYGSQGQQRAAILAMKLAEVQNAKKETGQYPVLLLDDVMSELDKKKRQYLLNNLEGIQTLITCTEDIPFLTDLNDKYKYIYV